jgi:hypothetical protein
MMVPVGAFEGLEGRTCKEWYSGIVRAGSCGHLRMGAVPPCTAAAVNFFRARR